MMALDGRLSAAAELVTPGGFLVDVGTDHGYVPIELAQRGIISHGLAMDVRKGPLERAKEHIRREGLEKQIECRRSNGMEKLEPGEVDTLMIAGMGGPLMIDILKARPEVLEKVQTLVLQPQSEIGFVREKLSEFGFELVQEKACRDEGKFYFAMLAKRSEKAGEPHGCNVSGTGYSTYLIEKQDPVMLEFLLPEKKVYDSILDRLAEQGNTGARRLEVEHLCTLLEELTEKMK